eukprot:gene9435-1695_t
MPAADDGVDVVAGNVVADGGAAAAADDDDDDDEPVEECQNTWQEYVHKQRKHSGSPEKVQSGAGLEHAGQAGDAQDDGGCGGGDGDGDGGGGGGVGGGGDNDEDGGAGGGGAGGAGRDEQDVHDHAAFLVGIWMDPLLAV